MIFARGYGMANLEHRVRITPATVFDVASVSKQFAGLAIEVKDRGLVMQHYRHGTIPLTPLWTDDFGGSMWFTRSVEFERDTSGRVIAFSVLVDERSRHIRFTKRDR